MLFRSGVLSSEGGLAAKVSALDSGPGDGTDGNSGGACEGGPGSGAVIEVNIARSILVGSGVPGGGSTGVEEPSSVNRLIAGSYRWT